MFKFLTTKFNLLVPKTEAPPLRDLQIDHSFHLSWLPILIIRQPACCVNIDICYIHMFAFKLNLLIHQKSFSSSFPPNKSFYFAGIFLLFLHISMRVFILQASAGQRFGQKLSHCLPKQFYAATLTWSRVEYAWTHVGENPNPQFKTIVNFLDLPLIV